jgi:alkylhydroperoxidase/carboxymuconolactone decarboxylase family protein YurZ
MSGATSGWHRPAATLAGVLVVYFAFPDRVLWTDRAFLVSVLLMVVGVVVLGWSIISQVRRQLTGEADDLQSLVTLLVLVLIVFAVGFYALERASPGEIEGLRTRIDSLYFTLATMATVGYGDVHAVKQVARAVVASQMVFNIVFVGALAAVLTGRVRIRVQERAMGRRGSPTRGDVPTLYSVPASAWASGLTSTGGPMDTGYSEPVDETTMDRLAGITQGDLTLLGLPGELDEHEVENALDRRTCALVRVASLVALDAPQASYRSQVSSALEVGVTAEELVDVLRAVAPHVGAPKAAAAATHVMAALGLPRPEPSKYTDAGDTARATTSPRSST